MFWVTDVLVSNADEKQTVMDLASIRPPQGASLVA